MPILGLHEFEQALQRVAADADRTGRLAVAKAASLAEKKAKANFEGAHKRGAPHVGGDKPNIVTGQARRSIGADPIRRYSIGDYGTKVGPRTIYARRLELGWPKSLDDGAPGHHVTRPFPFFTPAAEEARHEFPEIAAELWRRFLT